MPLVVRSTVILCIIKKRKTLPIKLWCIINCTICTDCSKWKKKMCILELMNSGVWKLKKAPLWRPAHLVFLNKSYQSVFPSALLSNRLLFRPCYTASSCESYVRTETGGITDRISQQGDNATTVRKGLSRDEMGYEHSEMGYLAQCLAQRKYSIVSSYYQ